MNSRYPLCSRKQRKQPKVGNTNCSRQAHASIRPPKTRNGWAELMTTESTLTELFLDELRDLYDAEQQLTRALPKAARASASEELRTILEEDLEQTKGHIDRLRRILELSGQDPVGKKCTAIAGLVSEINEIAAEITQMAVRDAGLIAAIQKIEHYE